MRDTIIMWIIAIALVFALPTALVAADFIACTSIKGNTYGGFPPHCIWPPLFPLSDETP